LNICLQRLDDIIRNTVVYELPYQSQSTIA
jgi:hypothetical protein